jgi:hypothetical protein
VAEPTAYRGPYYQKVVSCLRVSQSLHGDAISFKAKVAYWSTPNMASP